MARSHEVKQISQDIATVPDVTDIRVQVPKYKVFEGPGKGWQERELEFRERLSRQPSVAVEPASPALNLDGVDMAAYSGGWGTELSAEEVARKRKHRAEEIRLGRVARRLGKEPDGLIQMLGESKAKKWATGASKGKISATRPAIDEKTHLEEFRGSEEQTVDHVGLKSLAERDERVEFIGVVKDMIRVGWTRERIQQEISVFEEIGSFEIKPGYGFKEVMVGYENLSAWIWEENGREVWFDNGCWGYVDEEFDRWHDEALNGRHDVADGQIEDFYDTETYEGEEEELLTWEEEMELVPGADGRSKPFVARIEVSTGADDVSSLAYRGEVEIVSAEAYAMQEGIDPDNAERREQIREALRTAVDQGE